MRTLVTDDRWRGVLAAADIPTKLEPADLMQSWHRTHAGLSIGMVGLMTRAAARNGGVSRAEASLAARAMYGALSVVRRAGDRVTPAPIAAVVVVVSPASAPILSDPMDLPCTPCPGFPSACTCRRA
jgi:hypothetical protein